MEVKLPQELDKVSYEQVDGHFKRSEMIMALGIARIGEEEDRKVFRRLGYVSWVKKEWFVEKRFLLSRSSDSTPPLYLSIKSQHRRMLHYPPLLVTHSRLLTHSNRK